MLIPIRLDEENKTTQQIEQRELTYKAAAFLRANGFPCEVTEYFTGSCLRAHAAGIHLVTGDLFRKREE